MIELASIDKLFLYWEFSNFSLRKFFLESTGFKTWYFVLLEDKKGNKSIIINFDLSEAAKYCKTRIIDLAVLVYIDSAEGKTAADDTPSPPFYQSV